MSKSYNNTIPLWLPAKELRKAILGIVTNSLAPGEVKNPDDSNIFSIYQAFANAEETATMRQAYADGIGWGDAKQKLFERIDAELAPMRERYDALIAKPAEIEDTLQAGAVRARALATPFLDALRFAVGLRSLGADNSQAKNESKAPKSRKATLPRFIGPYREELTYKFRFENHDRKVRFVSIGYPTYPESMSALNELKVMPAAALRLGSLSNIRGGLTELVNANTEAELGALVVDVGVDANEALDQFVSERDLANVVE